MLGHGPPPDVGARQRQGLAFDSEEWLEVYPTLCNSIEGLNGFAKDGAHEAIGDPRRRRVRRIAAQRADYTTVCRYGGVGRVTNPTCRRTDLDPRSTPPRRGKSLVGTSSCCLTVFRSGTGC